MNNEIDENAAMDVEISRLRATEDEIKKLEALLTEKIGSISTLPKSILERTDKKGSIYQVTFKVTKPKSFQLETVRELLHSLTLVGWYLNGTFVPGE